MKGDTMQVKAKQNNTLKFKTRQCKSRQEMRFQARQLNYDSREVRRDYTIED